MKKGLARFVTFIVSLLFFGATSWAADPVMTTSAPAKTLKPVLQPTLPQAAPTMVAPGKTSTI